MTAQIEFESWLGSSLVHFLISTSLTILGLSSPFFLPVTIVVLFYKAGMQKRTFKEYNSSRVHTILVLSHILTHTHTCSLDSSTLHVLPFFLLFQQ